MLQPAYLENPASFCHGGHLQYCIVIKPVSLVEGLSTRWTVVTSSLADAAGGIRGSADEMHNM